jgi:carbamate kinase
VRLVIAIGGNALLERGQRPDAAVQRTNAVRAVEALAPLAADHQIVITHGNGPQVGLLALESAADPELELPYPLDVLGAQTQGMIGYWLLQALQNALPGRQVAAWSTRPWSSAATRPSRPTKFVGPVYDEATAHRLSPPTRLVGRRRRPYWRRVSRPAPDSDRRDPADPAPARSGRGRGLRRRRRRPGRPRRDGRLRASRRSSTRTSPPRAGRGAGRRRLLLLTDVPAVVRGFGEPHAVPISRATPAALAARTSPPARWAPRSRPSAASSR